MTIMYQASGGPVTGGAESGILNAPQAAVLPLS